ncbi:MAG: hypothetical protein M1816_005621 [Peltula sp. TS41687]|nr:MAG: hypothetical protein M1816_005621 [Peltula sp. TS41687]
MVDSVMPNGDNMSSNGIFDDFDATKSNGYDHGGHFSGQQRAFQIMDIRRDKSQHSVRAELMEKLHPKVGEEKQMPTVLLYDETGLKLFEEITYLDEYYLTSAEIEVLDRYADAIAQRIRPDSILMELGSGCLRKVKILLDAFERAGRDVKYFALDLSPPELNRTLSQLPTDAYRHVKCYGLHGTYDDGLAWIQSSERRSKPKCIMSLGSSIGNFTRDEAAKFLKEFAQALQSDDTMLIGVDGCKDKKKVFHAYNDEEGLTHRFIRNGLSHVNKILGANVFNEEDWTVIGEYDEKAGRHQAFYSPVTDMSFDNVKFRAGEKVRIEESYKYSEEDRLRLWSAAGLSEGARWADSTGDYHVHMLSKPTFHFPLRPDEYAQTATPQLSEWVELWAAWDALTKEMIPADELMSKPIDLRNPYIFYLGHIPTFLEIHLARATDGKFTGPRSYQRIFERGIDPDVDNPEKCHAHSEIPDSWPPLDEILSFEEHVRKRVKDFYEMTDLRSNSKLERALWLGFEHEVMHLETLLYMLMKSEKILPPPGSVRPDFEALAHEAEKTSIENEWFTIPEVKLTLGLGGSDNKSGQGGYYGWDNELPTRRVAVRPFLAQAGPITNGEYARYLKQTQKEEIPVSWAQKDFTNGVTSKAITSDNRRGVNGTTASFEDYLEGKYARTVYGTIPLVQALHWPVVASYDELAAYAEWMDGRIPTLEEVRSIYHYVEANSMPVSKVLAGKIAAVNGHLSNNGVEETPPCTPYGKNFSGAEQRPEPHKYFADLAGCNVGFTYWHPVPATRKPGKLCGQGEMGGVWEWTSSVLEKVEGFEPMDLYPAYTADFFDGKHNIVQGGSWATHPRIAGRKTL